MSGDEENFPNIRQPRTKKGKKILDNRKSKLEEGPRNTLFLRGPKSSDDVRSFMMDIYQIKKDYSVLFSRKHDVRPFENDQLMETYCTKNDCSLFCYVAHSKKRQNNVVIGRTFDNKVLDMLELGLKTFKSQESFQKAIQVPVHSRPLLVFQGEVFGYHTTFQKIHNLFTDFFYQNIQAAEIKSANSLGLVIYLTGTESELTMQVFQRYENGGEIKTEEIGPHCVFEVRREKFADADLLKKSFRVPKFKKKAHKKNMKYDDVGDRKGRIFIQQQDLATLPIKRRKKITKADSKQKKIIESQKEAEINE